MNNHNTSISEFELIPIPITTTTSSSPCTTASRILARRDAIIEGLGGEEVVEKLRLEHKMKKGGERSSRLAVMTRRRNIGQTDGNDDDEEDEDGEDDVKLFFFEERTKFIINFIPFQG